MHKSLINKLFMMVILGLTPMLFGFTSTPTGQLPKNVVPTAYKLSFDIDPENATFTGSTVISLEVKQASDHFYLNALDMEIKEVYLNNHKGLKIAADITKT
ncbi:MAG: hypothetical protein L3J46_10980, partial [Kangiellaceae bacterium]|nr:hypothetical protein [Kangiellaceae bacterium]